MKPITRRDYLNATLLGSGALLMQGISPAQLLSASDWDGYGGVGDYRHANGNTYDVMVEGHRLRDNAFNSPKPIDTGEHYDCVIAGGGVSGLAAALFFQRQSTQRQGGSKRTSLVIDDHAIFGGLAKQNEFDVDGQRLVANQASAMFFPQFSGTFLDEFYRSIGITDQQFPYQQWVGSQPEIPVGRTPYFNGDRHSGFFFGSRFGRSQGAWSIDPWGQRLKDAPISELSKRELLKAQDAGPEELPQQHGDPLSKHLDSITLEDHLVTRFGISRETIRTFLSPEAGGGSGLGADALSAYAEYAADVLFPWDKEKGAQMFPGGNAGVARHILKTLRPDAIAGPSSMPGTSRGAVNFDALDTPGRSSRVRLRSTIASIQHDKTPDQASTVKIVYSRDGRLYSVTANSVIVASGSWTAKYIVRDLPASHRDAYSQFHRSPALVANVALRNWRFLYKLGITQAQWFEGIGNYTAVRKLPTFGPVSSTISPDSPVVLTLKILFSYPGLSLEEQVKKGRAELLSSPYSSYERQIQEQFTAMFGPAGFDVHRDWAGLVLNRWGHAYLSPQPGFFFGAHGQPAPGEILRSQPVGRIAFANSDLSGIMDHRSSIVEAHRAVKQCIEKLRA